MEDLKLKNSDGEIYFFFNEDEELCINVRLNNELLVTMITHEEDVNDLQKLITTK